MVEGRKDPEGVIVRAEDGHLAWRSMRSIEAERGKVNIIGETEENDVKELFEEGSPEWKSYTKRQLDDYAKEFGINLDRRKKLVDMQADFEEALKDKDDQVEE